MDRPWQATRWALSAGRKREKGVTPELQLTRGVNLGVAFHLLEPISLSVRYGKMTSFNNEIRYHFKEPKHSCPGAPFLACIYISDNEDNYYDVMFCVCVCLCLSVQGSQGRRCGEHRAVHGTVWDTEEGGPFPRGEQRRELT